MNKIYDTQLFKLSIVIVLVILIVLILIEIIKFMKKYLQVNME